MESENSADVARNGRWEREREKNKMREMDAFNCQFYETRIAKVSCYRCYRRRRALITKSPRDDKVIIDHEKKKIRLVACPHHCMPELI